MIVVDNGSTDGSVDALRKQFRAKIQIIESKQNLGFSGGNNLGIQQALRENAEWILLINNDTQVAPTFLSELEKVADNYKEFGIIGPLILYTNQQNTIWYLGDRIVPGTLVTYSLYRGKVEQPTYPEVLAVDFITGCAMLVNRKVFESIGLMDTTLFMYGEDVDFCWRARRAGFKFAAAPRARMWHKVSTSAAREKEIHRYLRTRNQNRFYRKYSRRLQIPIMLGFSLLQLARRIGSDLLNLQPELVTPLVRGWIDGWFNPDHPVKVSYGTNDL